MEAGTLPKNDGGSKSQEDLKNEDNPKNKDDPKKENHPKQGDNIKNEVDPKIEKLGLGLSLAKSAQEELPPRVQPGQDYW